MIFNVILLSNYAKKDMYTPWKRKHLQMNPAVPSGNSARTIDQIRSGSINKTETIQLLYLIN